MLTSLDFLNPGQPWIPKSERSRMDKYEHNKELFKGHHVYEYEEQFKRIERVIGNFGNVISYPVIINYQKLITLKIVDMILGEEPKIESESESESLEELKINNDIYNLAYKVAIDVSRYGDGLFYVYGDGKITFTQPTLWYPVVDQFDITQITAHVLAYTIVVGQDATGQVIKQLVAQIHNKGNYETRKYQLVSGVYGDTIGNLIESNIVSTGLDDFAIIHVPNLQTSDSLFGYDDYTDVDSIVSEILVRIGQISRILDKHADPSIQGPISALEQDPATGQWRLRAGNYFVRQSTDDPAVEYVTWDGQLESAFKHIELLTNALYIVSETGATLLGETDKTGSAASGTALRLKMLSPQTKAKRIKMRFDPAIKLAISLASQLTRKIIDKNEISITWQDGIINDKREEAEIMAIRTGNKPTISQKSAIERLDDKNEAQAEEELAEINNEDQMMDPTVLPSFAQPDPMMDGGGND